MGQLFDLPAHPLLVHAPVVLVPLLTIVAIALVARPVIARRYRWHVVAAVGAGLVSMLVARRSGQELNEAFDGVVDVSTHASLADTATLLTFLWFLATVAAAAVFQWQVGAPRSVGAAAIATDRHLVGRVALGVAAALAVLATIWLIRTGHEGAYSHWKPIGDQYFE